MLVLAVVLAVLVVLVLGLGWNCMRLQLL